MTAHDPIRRRLLVGFGITAAAGLTGVLAAIRQPSGDPVAVASTTSAPVSTTVSPAPVADDTPTTLATTATVATRELRVVCRAAWGARPPSPGMVEHTIQRLTLHHTAALLADNSDAPARARSHQAYHQGEGFADLAYHFIVDAKGNILEGRSLDFAGETFTEYDPNGHLLVCCEGDFDDQVPTDAQLAAVADLFAWGAGTYGVPVETLGGHRDYADTSCPGERLYPLVADGTLAGMIAGRLTETLLRVDVCGADGVALVQAIEEGT